MLGGYVNIQCIPTPKIWVAEAPGVGSTAITGSDADAVITGSDADAPITGSD